MSLSGKLIDKNRSQPNCIIIPILHHDKLGYFRIPRDSVATLPMSQCVCYPHGHQYPFVYQSHLEAKKLCLFFTESLAFWNQSVAVATVHLLDIFEVVLISDG